MRAKVRKSLVEALEGNEYKQGRGLLKFLNSKNEICHCVTGVIAELYEKATRAKKGKFIEVGAECFTERSQGYYTIKRRKIKAVYSIGGNMTHLPHKICSWAWMSPAEVGRILSLNDTGVSFKRIARIIREENIFDSRN